MPRVTTLPFSSAGPTTIVRLRNEPEPLPTRNRCYTCFRPVDSCFCGAIPSIDNRTHILILQHVKERFHPFNSARIVRHALKNADLIVDQTAKLAKAALPFRASTGVLYPADDATLLSDVPVRHRPEQLVILDGTWHHTKTFMKQIPALQQLPKFRLQPAAPSNYRIRKEPTETAISTLEATVQSLQILEPETPELNKLLLAFDSMIDPQAEHPRVTGRVRLPKRARSPAANIPSVVMDELNNLVVAYGEAARGINGVRTRNRKPVYWVAQRLGTSETFECAIEPDRRLTENFLSLLQLTVDDFDAATSVETFRDSWKAFLKPTDTIAVFNQSTIRLLDSVNAISKPSVALKSVDLNLEGSTLDKAISQLQLAVRPVVHRGRAGQRLANLIAYTRHLASIER